MPPDRKSALILSDNFCPYLSRESFVKVKADRSPGQNRPGGYITMCHGVGGVTVCDVKYTPVYNRGRTPLRIRLDYLIPCFPFVEIIVEGVT